MDGVFLALAQREGQLLLWFQEAVRRPWLDPIVSFYTTLGNHGLLWIALTVLLLLWPKTRKAGKAMALALVCSLLLTNGLLKHLAQRTRPWLIFEQLLPLVVEKDPNSFPSGHTSAAFAAVTALLWARPRLPEEVKHKADVPVLLMMAVCMGFSRLYVGVHFPVDVLCGALVGTLCGFLGWKLSVCVGEKWEGREDSKGRKM